MVDRSTSGRGIQLISILLLSITVLGLVGCSQLLPVSKDLNLRLLPPNEGPGNKLLKQKVIMKHHGQQQQFLMITRLDETGITLVSLLPSGQKLFTVTYDGRSVTQPHQPAVELPVQNILAMLQFSLWPPKSISQNYKVADGWSLLLNRNHRRLSSASGDVLVVKHDAETTLIENIRKNYRVIIKPLETRDL